MMAESAHVVYWCTYQRQLWGMLGPEFTGARTSGIAGMPEPARERANPPWATVPKERRAPTQGLAGVIFSTLSASKSPSWTSADTCLRSFCGSCILVGDMSVLGAVFQSFYLASLRFSLRPKPGCHFQLKRASPRA